MTIQEQPRRFTCDIVVTSDLHGAIRPVNYSTNKPVSTGLAMLASRIRALREQSPELLLIDNGDLIQGSPLAALAAASAASQGEFRHPCILALNELAYDAAVIGNHEFNYGQALLRKAVLSSRFPWLSANIVETDTGEPAFGPPYLIKELSPGIKVALLGVTTHYIPNWEQPDHIEGLTFKDALETVQIWVERIREQENPDLLIVCYHGGLECDPVNGEPTERLTGENQAYAMARHVRGIDVLLTGHQHRLLAEEIDGVTVVQPGSGGTAAGHVSVELEQLPGGKWRIRQKQARLLFPEKQLPPDPMIMRLTDELEHSTQQWLDQPIGHTETDLSIASAYELRLAAHPFIDLVHQVQMEATGAEISCTALLSESSPGFQGEITVRDVLSNFIYPNTLTVLELKGQDIRDALEQTALYFQLSEDGAIMVNPAFTTPKPQHFNYDMWAGIEYVLDIGRPPGSRVVKLERGGIPLDMEATYAVVMNNYRAAGGGDYSMYVGKPVRLELATEMAELVQDYIRRNPKLSASPVSSWKITARGEQAAHQF